MQRKQNAITSLMTLAVSAALALGASAGEAAKVDANGTWKWSGPARRDGSPGAEMSVKLKVEGDKVTGALTRPGRGQDAAPIEQAITDGKITGNQISFNVVNEGRGGGPGVTNKYEGKIDGDTIKGTQPPQRGGGGRRNQGGDTGGGAPPAAPAPIPWEAKRAK